MGPSDLIRQVALRLEAIMKDTGMQTVKDLADEVGASRSQVSNWLNRYHLPPVPYMISLCEQKGLTLDWIYRGDPSGLSYAAAKRLQAIMKGLETEHIEAPQPSTRPVNVRAVAKAPAPKALRQASTKSGP
jgi:hypothetical protein